MCGSQSNLRQEFQYHLFTKKFFLFFFFGIKEYMYVKPALWWIIACFQSLVTHPYASNQLIWVQILTMWWFLGFLLHWWNLNLRAEVWVAELCCFFKFLMWIVSTLEVWTLFIWNEKLSDWNKLLNIMRKKYAVVMADMYSLSYFFLYSLVTKS